MSKKLLPIEKILTLLEKNPEAIVGFSADLTPAQLSTAPNPDQWSAVQLLAHLRSCADVWGGCITTILAEDHPTIRAINPRTWIEKNSYREVDFQSSFHAFTTQRTQLLKQLKSLAPEDWQRGAIVTGAGKPLDRTVQFYAQWLAEHERSHLKQFRQIASAMLSE